MHYRFPPSFCHRVTLLSVGFVAGLLLLLAAPVFALDASTTSAAKIQSQATASTTANAVEKAQNAGHPVVALQTNLGALYLELFPEQAPKSVENFLRYVNDGFYDGTVFHRVIEGFMIQGGGFDLHLTPRKTRAAIINEADNGLLNEKFTVAMVRNNGPDSATSQFFINTANNDFLNHIGKTPTSWGYAVFGRLISGMRIAEWMSQAPTGPDAAPLANALAAPTDPDEPLPSDVPVTPLIIERAQLLP